MSGVFVYTSAAHNNVILGNYIGTNVSGSGKIGNGVNGLQINGAGSNWVAQCEGLAQRDLRQRH